MPARLSRLQNTPTHIAIFTLLVSLSLWAPQWNNFQLHVHTSNPQGLAILLHGKSRDPYLLHIARAVWWFTAMHDILIQPCDNVEQDGVAVPTKFLALPVLPFPDFSGF